MRPFPIYPLYTQTVILSLDKPIADCFLFRPRKSRKSAGNAVIPTFPAHCPHGLQHLRYKRPTFVYIPESGYTLAFANRIAHNGSHGKTRGVSDGGAITTLGAFRTFTNISGPGVRTANFAALGPWSGVLPKNAESLGTAIRLCASLSRGVAVPLGCVICLQLCDVAVFSLCAQGFPHMQKRGWYYYPRRAPRAAEVLDTHLSKRLICRFPGLVTSSLISAA